MTEEKLSSLIDDSAYPFEKYGFSNVSSHTYDWFIEHLP